MNYYKEIYFYLFNYNYVNFAHKGLIKGGHKMKRSINVIALLVSVFLLLGSLVACGSSGEKNAPDAAVKVDETTKAPAEAAVDKPKENVTLKYMMWDPAMKDKEIATLIRPFEHKYPNIKVEFQGIPWGDYWKKLDVLFAAGTPPDVFYMSVAFPQEYAAKGVIKNLQPLIDADPETAGLNDFYGSIMDQFKYKGDIYAFPYSWVTSVLYYNKSMFDKAGVSYPTENWTWDDLVAAAKTLTTGEGVKKQFGFLSDYSTEKLDAYVQSLGGEIITDDYKTSKINDPVVLEGLQFFYDLIYKDNVSPSPAQTKGLPDMFLSGKVAMSIAGSYQIETYRAIKDFDWDIAMVPITAKTGKRVIYGGGDPVVIGEKSAHPDEAWEFVKFYCGKDRPMESLMGGKVPVYIPNAGDEWLEKDKKPTNKDVILKSAEYVKGAEFGFKWIEWRNTVMGGELEAALLGKKSVKEAADVADAKVQVILDEIGK